MSREGQPAHVATLELLEGPPTVVDAGAEVRMVVRTACPSECDLASAPLVVEGAEAARVQLVHERDRGGHGTDTEIVLRAPAEVGRARWTVRLAETELGGIAHDCAELRVGSDVVPHRTSVAIWQVPSPLEGSAFSVRVGVKCSARCHLGGERVRVYADSEEWLGEGKLASDPRPGSDGLYEAEVSLPAPDAAGVFFRRARFDGHGLALPHEATEATFSFRALQPPECTITLRVVTDAVAPLDGIEVRLGPYRAETDDRGIARLDVPKGAHELSVWRIDVEPVAREVDVSGDAELTLPVTPRRRADADEEREWM